METIKLDLEVITPMFLSGANQQAAELRPQTIKGVLRFWWRALQAEADLSALSARESLVFGSAGEGGVRQSGFSLRILRPASLAPVTNPFPSQHTVTFFSKTQGRKITINILEYLAYGPFDPKTKKVRPCFPPGSQFSLCLSFTNATVIGDVVKALLALTHFGGMGSRSRNGFGSLCLRNSSEGLAHLPLNLNVDKYYAGENLKRLVKDGTNITPYSSFCKGTRLFRTKSNATWHEALAEVGKLYRGIRVGDYKLDERVFEQKHSYDKREYLGAPLDPYIQNFHSLLERHAKPYFMKVAKENDGYRGYILYLPSLYAEGLKEGRNNRPITQKAANTKFLEVCAEFNAFLARHTETVV